MSKMLAGASEYEALVGVGHHNDAIEMASAIRVTKRPVHYRLDARLAQRLHEQAVDLLVHDIDSGRISNEKVITLTPTVTRELGREATQETVSRELVGASS